MSEIRGRDAKNIKYEYELDEIKQWFLNFLKETKEYSKTTLSNYENIMHKVTDFEELFKDGKKLQYFNHNERIEMLKSFRSASKTSLMVYLSVIKSFLEFCMANNIIENNMDFIRGLDFSELEKYIDIQANKEKYINEKDLYESLNSINNPQDQLIPLLVFEGIRGKENIEITELLNDDVNFDTHELKYGENKEKVLKLNPILEGVIEETMKEMEYWAKNADVAKLNDKASEKKRDVYELENSEFLIRPNIDYHKKQSMKDAVAEGKLKDGQVLGMLIQKRILATMKGILDRPYVTVNSLYISGLINRAVRYSINTKGGKMDQNEFVQYFKETENRTDGYRVFEIYEQLFDNFSKNLMDF